MIQKQMNRKVRSINRNNQSKLITQINAIIQHKLTNIKNSRERDLNGEDANLRQSSVYVKKKKNHVYLK